MKKVLTIEPDKIPGIWKDISDNDIEIIEDSIRDLRKNMLHRYYMND